MADSNDGQPRIYLLPNLMTAGNLFCGFAAVMRILEGALIQATLGPAGATTMALAPGAADKFHQAIWFILAACIFDMLDGRVARLGGTDSPFGREFDSLADIVSFGVAPALMVYRIILHDFQKFGIGWIVASIYLICGALRLARFNCMAAVNSDAANREFKGFPIPAAAGVIASLTLFLLWTQENDHTIGKWRYGLPVLMLFLSWMMFSGFRYPSFKAINWRTTRSIPKMIIILGIIGFTAVNMEWMPAVLFISYLLYGFFRPFVSQAMRRKIEEEDEEDEEKLDEVAPLKPEGASSPDELKHS